jgi:pSer/pThr/pTyr-binding forkhead associated (FHA) protein
MVQLKILSGKKAGDSYIARRFPVRIGRSADSDLQLEESGIWEQHLLLRFSPGEGFRLSVVGEALVRVNDQAVNEIVLRNGDSLDLGATRLQFWLGETAQYGLRTREVLTWVCIGMVSLAQVFLIYLLLR